MSCNLFARWKTIYEGTYQGVPYVLQSRETKGFSTNHLDWRVQLGDLPAAEITALTTDWGPPYSNDLFGASPYCYTAQTTPAYRSDEDTSFSTRSPTYTMLYLSPKTFSQADYQHYCGFMRSEWAAIDKTYAQQPYSHFPHLLGLVYARQEDLTKQYQGRYQPYPTVEPTEFHRAFLRIQNDGRVQLVDEDESGNIRYSGLSSRVQMPGKRLYLNPDPKYGGLYSLSIIRSFKDTHGRSPDMDFEIIQQQP